MQNKFDKKMDRVKDLIKILYNLDISLFFINFRFLKVAYLSILLSIEDNLNMLSKSDDLKEKVKMKTLKGPFTYLGNFRVN